MQTEGNNLSLSPLFSDGMVLQRETPVKIWGKAAPNQQIRINFCDQTSVTTADPEGNWLIGLEPLMPGGPFVMRIRSEHQEIVINDILIGDLWLLGGQSNMELPINRTLDLYGQEVQEANNPFIRQFTVPMVYDFQGPRTELSGGEWKAVTPENVLAFSALGYFYAQELFEKYQVPIGLIQTAVGGTPVEAWLSEEVIRKIGGYEELLARCQDDHFVEKTIATENQEMDRWYRQLNQEDEGNHRPMMIRPGRLWTFPAPGQGVNWKGSMGRYGFGRNSRFPPPCSKPMLCSDWGRLLMRMIHISTEFWLGKLIINIHPGSTRYRRGFCRRERTPSPFG